MFKWKDNIVLEETKSDLVVETVKCKHATIIQNGSTGLNYYSLKSKLYNSNSTYRLREVDGYPTLSPTLEIA